MNLEAELCCDFFRSLYPLRCTELSMCRGASPPWGKLFTASQPSGLEEIRGSRDTEFAVNTACASRGNEVTQFCLMCKESVKIITGSRYHLRFPAEIRAHGTIIFTDHCILLMESPVYAFKAPGPPIQAH